MKHWLFSIWLASVVLTGLRCDAQLLHANGPLPNFEVATIKPWQPAPRPLAADGAPLPVKVAKV